MKAWVIKKGEKYVAGLGCSDTYTKDINKAMFYLTKKSVKEDCYSADNETIVTVDVQIEEINGGDNQ